MTFHNCPPPAPPGDRSLSPARPSPSRRSCRRSCHAWDPSRPTCFVLGVSPGNSDSLSFLVGHEELLGINPGKSLSQHLQAGPLVVWLTTEASKGPVRGHAHRWLPSSSWQNPKRLQPRARLQGPSSAIVSPSVPVTRETPSVCHGRRKGEWFLKGNLKNPKLLAWKQVLPQSTQGLEQRTDGLGIPAPAFWSSW